MPPPKTTDELLLAPGITVAQYREWQDAVPPNRDRIADMVRKRFESRFIEPVLRDGHVQGGFAAVALCCLAIQALDSFQNGRSEPLIALRSFVAENEEFATLRGIEQQFYDNVRNALHYQAETSGGWRIRVVGPLFDRGSQVIGAEAFVEGFRRALDRYCDQIRKTHERSLVWEMLLKKMQRIVKAGDAEFGVT